MPNPTVPNPTDVDACFHAQVEQIVRKQFGQLDTGASSYIPVLLSVMLLCCSRMTVKRRAGNAKRRASSAAQLKLSVEVDNVGSASESPASSPANVSVGDEQRAAFDLEALRAHRPEITPIGMNSKTRCAACRDSTTERQQFACDMG